MSGTSESMKGNKNGVKIKDPDLRQKAYKQFCDWLSRGKSPRSFTFEEGDLICTGETIESYIKECPSEFSAIQRSASYAKGYALWEQVVEDSAIGKNQRANTASLQMTMRNKFKWDTKEHVANVEEKQTDLRNYSEALKEQRAQPVEQATDRID